MTRDEFKAHISATIENVIQHAEQKLGRSLPRKYCFQLFASKTAPVPQEQVADYLADYIYIDSEHIYPCFDIGVG